MSEAGLVGHIRHASAEVQALVCNASMSDLTALADVPQLVEHLVNRQLSVPPTPPDQIAHDINFTIAGTQLQYVQVKLFVAATRTR